MKKYCVDRVEEQFALLVDENGNLKEISFNLLPEIKEGDILLFDGENYTLDLNETEKRRKESKRLIDALFQ